MLTVSAATTCLRCASFIGIALTVGVCASHCSAAGDTAAVATIAPLHERIDQLVETRLDDFAAVAAPRSSDAEFVRRIYLDLNGSIPNTGQTKQFLADTTDTKRESLIDRLLYSPQFA
ncbi:MAG: DUF1549 domain-containing protein, partial [Planctomycetota bacterium]|nr:DUF1549 domain-containing protein [Planctomycetota bacterium]